MSRVRWVQTARSPSCGWFLVLVVLARGASAQSTESNVVTASADAFGVAIGVEALGVYGPSQVRGFDPLAAGNARIEGMYADVLGQVIPYGPLPTRLVQDTRIRVGQPHGLRRPLRHQRFRSRRARSRGWQTLRRQRRSHAPLG